jgi:heat shock protein HslJ
MLYKSLSIILLFSLVIISCSPVKKATQDSTTIKGIELKGVRWKLISFENDTTPLRYNIHFQLSEDSNKMYGQGTCNTINGTYNLDTKYKIKFQNLIMSWKACNDDGYEKRYLELLREASHYKIETGKLLLYSEQKNLAVFIKVAEK